MNNTYKAKRTEYRGIVFDSKSEAVFARTLDIAGVAWQYHPPVHCGHEWDFLVGGNDSAPTALARHGTLVEYKPSPPTDSYITWLTETTRADPVESCLIWGNPWAGDVTNRAFGSLGCCYVFYPIFCSFAKYGWGDFSRPADNGDDEVPYSFRHNITDVLGIRCWMPDQALEYRFDLKNGGRFAR